MCGSQRLASPLHFRRPLRVAAKVEATFMSHVRIGIQGDVSDRVVLTDEERATAQVLFHIKALETPEFLRNKVGVEPKFGAFPRERLNPNGGSVALGHPFGATGARIISQALKELSIRPPGSRAIVSICTDGGQGAVVLLEAAK